jgi:phosphotransferase system HPr-like phosphotransfer protein
MTANRLTCSVRVAGEHGLQQSDAVALSGFAQDFDCELYLSRGNCRADAKNASQMIEVSHLSDKVIILDADGQESRPAIAFFVYFLLNHLEPPRDEMALGGLSSRAAGKPAGQLSLNTLSPREALGALALVAANSRYESSHYDRGTCPM